MYWLAKGIPPYWRSLPLEGRDSVVSLKATKWHTDKSPHSPLPFFLILIPISPGIAQYAEGDELVRSKSPPITVALPFISDGMMNHPGVFSLFSFIKRFPRLFSYVSSFDSQYTRTNFNQNQNQYTRKAKSRKITSFHFSLIEKT